MTKNRELESARALVLCTVPVESRILCAVSGGLDSMCLLHWMTSWGEEQNFSVAAAHFNHRLRGDRADRDEAFVREMCGRWNVPLTVGRGDVKSAANREGLSVEEAARRLRYAFLKQTAEQMGKAWIFTAHHADDNAETMLLNLTRGTGVRGLAGIPPERSGILRPFLKIPREELAVYAAAHGIPYVEDETNADPDAASRNLLRLQVMPLLREVNPRAAEHMGETARQLREIDEFLEREADRHLAQARMESGGVELALSQWCEVPAAVRSRVLLGLFDRLGAGRRDVGAVHLEALSALVGKDGGQLDLPGGVTARYRQGHLRLEQKSDPPCGEAVLAYQQPLRWGAYTLTLLDHREGAGLALLPGGGTLTVTPCRAEDRLTLPSTHGGSRSIKRLCVDRRISLAQRAHLPAIYADGCLAAVWGLGVDLKFLPEGEPCRFIQIRENTEESSYEQ